MPSHRARRSSLSASAPVLLAVAIALAGCAGAPATAPPSQPPQDSPPETGDPARRAQVRLELAAAYLANGQASTALNEVRQALALQPDSGDAYNLRGLIYGSLGEARLAEESFQRALQLNAGDTDAMHNYGWFLCQQKRFADANARFEQALQVPQYRAQPRTLLAQGVCQARAGQWADAERSLLRAYEFDPSSPVTAVNLSEVLLRRGELERARFYIRRVNTQPAQANAQSLWLAARIERKMGNTAALQELAKELRERFPRSPETLALDRGQFDD